MTRRWPPSPPLDQENILSNEHRGTSPGADSGTQRSTFRDSTPTTTPSSASTDGDPCPNPPAPSTTSTGRRPSFRPPASFFGGSFDNAIFHGPFNEYLSGYSVNVFDPPTGITQNRLMTDAEAVIWDKRQREVGERGGRINQIICTSDDYFSGAKFGSGTGGNTQHQNVAQEALSLGPFFQGAGFSYESLEFGPNATIDGNPVTPADKERMDRAFRRR